MKFRDAEHPDGAAKVTELHLSGNQLTVQSLEKLGEVIALSAGDLREFDLSRNRIEVCDDEQKERWFGLLVQFDGCYVLKKIDLGHNKLGIKGVEMLARAYLRSELDFVEGEVEEVGANGEEEDGAATAVDGVALRVNGHKENDNPGRSRSKRSPGKGKAKQNGMKRPPAHIHIYDWTNMMDLFRSLWHQLFFNWEVPKPCRSEAIRLHSRPAVCPLHHPIQHIHDNRCCRALSQYDPGQPRP